MSNPKIKKLRAEVNAELERIYQERGALRASEVVDEASAETSPLHGHFEWDDAKAGHEYRLQQARTLIRVCVITTDADNKTKDPEPYVWVPPKGGESTSSKEGEYHPASIIVQNADWFARAYSAATSKLEGARRALDDLKHAAETEPDHADKVPLIRIALEALATADSAVRRIH